jgi:outer membrane biosynthesis protein TonB
MLARAALSGLISIVALSVAPAHSQPSGAGSSGLLSPAPLTGSGPERRFIPPDRSVAAPSSTATSPQEVEQDPTPPLQEQTAAPSASTPPTPRRDIAPAATQTTPKQPPRHRRTASAPQPRREAVKEASIQKRQGTQRSQVRQKVRQQVKSRGQASTWVATEMRATREARRTAPAVMELAPRGEPQLPLGLMPRHARRE